MIRKYGAMPDAVMTAEIAGGPDMRRAASAALGVPAVAEFRRVAHRESFANVTRRDGYLYVRNRAVSSRVNGNYDAFPAGELATEAPGFGWQTFLGKPVFVNHHNSDHRRARGVNIAAALHEDAGPDGKADVWVELLKEVDAKQFPKLAKAVLTGRVNRTSMGVDATATRCVNHCGNWATDVGDFCNAIPALKGLPVEQHPPNGPVRMAKVYEIIAGCAFFEDSLLVEPPADPTALILGVDQR